jgi:DNA-directed RNA polymerase subunit RPC12/RpoP
MTSETRTVIEATDIKALELECVKCGFRTVWPLSQWNGRYVKCATCGESWPVSQNAAYEALNQAVVSLSVVAKAEKAAIPFKIHFELVERKEKQ